MNIADIILILLIAAALVFAVRASVKNAKSGSCCGDCTKCSGCNKE
ncbi:FeoB-associated Cys-rich membrane protein [Ruminococcus flavefaciens]|nr:FeoB-associated Cys-rich membrane protein [Ruminococcus flavefaciens]